MFLRGAAALLALGAVASSASPTTAALSVANTTVEYTVNPLAVDIDWLPRPRFGWLTTGGQQTAYRIQVYAAAAPPPGGSPVWDSGSVASSASAQIPFGGPVPLPYDTDYVWQVTVTAAGGAQATSSPLSSFTTGIDGAAFAASPWRGGCTTGQQSPQLRLSFSLGPGAVTRARAYATGLGIYTLHMNGQRVGAPDMLTPGWSTVPTVRLLGNAYDVQPLLTAGAENVVGMRLGQGKYGYVYEFCAAGDATCYAGLLRLVITQKGGNTTVLTTGSDNWECAPSPIVFNHLFGGETYNASLEQAGWDAPGFEPPQPWSPAPLASPNVSTVSTGGPPPIQVMRDVTPVSVQPGPSSPVVAGGRFVKCPTSDNVWWVADANTTKNFVVVCQPCPTVPACSLLNTVPCSFIDGLTQGANFSCSMLPNSTNGSPWIFDTGRNMAGVCSLSLPASAPEGTTLTLVHGEILDDAGNVDNTFGASTPPRTCNVNVINCADQQDAYVYGPAAPTSPTYTPSFTFHGFRHVALFGWPATAPPPTTATLTCHQAFTALADAGSVTFNDSALNAVQAAIVQTQKSNLFSLPSDCPTREKRGWMGDAQASAAQAILNLRMAPLYENFARSMSDTLFLGCANPSSSSALESSAVAAVGGPVRPPTYLCCADRSEFGCQPGITPQNATFSLPDVVVFDSISGWPGDFVWEVAGEVIPYLTLQAEGNVPYLTTLWPFISAHMDFISTVASEASDGLLHFGPYSDWLAEEPVSTRFAANWYLVYGAQASAYMAGALGQAQEAAAFTAFAATTAANMAASLFDASAGVWDGAAGNMNAQAMALAIGLAGSVTANASATIVKAMVDDCTARGNHPSGGVASVRWTLQGLAAGNRSDLSLAMATVPTTPSWAYMAESEDMPGTIWEAWTGDATHSDGSKNHPMLTGGIGAWLYDYALGLRFQHRLQGGDDDEADGGLLLERLRASPLGFDPRARFGLSSSATRAVLDVVDAAREERGGWPMDRFRRELAARGVASTAASPLSPTLTVMPHAAIVRALGSASGWHATPYGKTSVAWEWRGDASSGPGLSLSARVPSGVLGRLALPLSLLLLLTEGASSSSSSSACRVTVAAAAAGEGARTLLDVKIVLADAELAADGCEPLGRLAEGRAVSVCGLLAGGQAVAPASPLGAPRLVTWAEAEGEGRLHFAGEPEGLASLAAGYLLVEGPGSGEEWAVSASRAE